VILSASDVGDPNTSGTFFAKLDAGGRDLWSQRFQGARARAVATSSADEIALTGTLVASAVDLGGGPLTNETGQDLFLALFGP
jgi:hypothetical protein